MTLNEILHDAETNGNKHYVYVKYKKQIEKLNLPPEEYEQAIHQLCETLEY
jgi:hypothetical protein